MDLANIIEVVIVAAIVALAVLVLVRSFRKKKCSCGCASSDDGPKSASCAHCPMADRDK